MLVRALLIAWASSFGVGISFIGLFGVLYPHEEHVMLRNVLDVVRMWWQCLHFTMVFIFDRLFSRVVCGRVHFGIRLLRVVSFLELFG